MSLAYRVSIKESFNLRSGSALDKRAAASTASDKAIDMPRISC